MHLNHGSPRINPERWKRLERTIQKIATSYYDLKQFDKALEYDKLSLAYRAMSNHEEVIAWAYVYVCDDFIALKQLDSCLVYLTAQNQLFERLKIIG